MAAVEPSANATWYGTARLTPDAPVTAGEYGTWEFTYTAGRYGIDNTGSILVCWRFASDWARPQTSDPVAENYLTARTTAAARLDVQYRFKAFQRPWYHVAWVDVLDGDIAPGDEIVLTYGDTSGGSPGHRAQTAVESASLWQVFVDPLNTRRFVALDDCPSVGIVCGPAERIVVTIPSQAACGGTVSTVIRAQDMWGNVAEEFAGAVDISLEGDVEAVDPVRCVLTAGDRGVKRVDVAAPPEPGVWRLRARHVDTGLEAISNPCICSATPSDLSRYWGDNHGQSSEALGLGTVRDYFAYARDMAAIDFATNQGNDLDISDEGWTAIQSAAKEFYEPGRFVAFLGYEWSGNSSCGGDRNVIFLGDDETIYRSSHLNVDDGGSDPSTDRCPVSELFGEFDGRTGVLSIPHVGGRYANLAFHDSALEPVIEVYSGWGLFEWFIDDALRRGMIVGFCAGSDDHKGRPGAAQPGTKIFGVYGGLTCVPAAELSRESIFRGLKERRCYATSGARIIVDATCDGHPIGAEFHAASAPTIRGRVVGCDGIDSAEIFRFDHGDDAATRAHAVPINDDAPLSNRIRVAWTGMRQIPRYFQTVWDGSLKLSAGSILHAEPYAFDTPLERIVEQSERHVTWKSQTTGDEDGVIVEIDAPSDARLHFTSEPCKFDIRVGDIGADPTVFPAGGVGQRITVQRLRATEPPSDVSFEWQDDGKPSARRTAYYLKVKQMDGHVAFTSPWYIRGE